MYGDTATYKCIANHWFDDGVYKSTAVCGGDGKWQSVPNNCTGGETLSCYMSYSEQINSHIYVNNNINVGTQMFQLN